MSSPRVVIGAPVYNHEREFREAIESILSQTFSDFRLIIVDDGSTDGTESLARQYAEIDSRIQYVRNDQRLGMIDNWRRAFDLSLERWPEAEYFAWASDHDVWHPRWLAAMVRTLEQAPEAVLAYPLNRRIGPTGDLTDKRSWKFDTRGVQHRGRRFRRALMNMSAGNMIYGLMRARDVRACGVFRRVLVPDRLLIMELSLRGEFRQVPEVLWLRRWYGRIFSLGRQRQSFFPKGRPLYALVPWWISHAAVLGWVYGVQRTDAAVSRPQGLLLSLTYFWLAGLLHFRQQMKQLRVDVLERATFLRPAYHRMRELRRRISKKYGLGDAARQTRKTLTDSGRRRRLAAKAVKRGRRNVYAVQAGTSRLAARGLRVVPGLGSRLLPWLLREQLQMSIGAIELVHLQRQVAKLKAGKGPLLVGPFLGEPEYELLYWIPFLRWFQKEAAIEPGHMIAVSRGGVGSWYEGICGRYVDALDIVRLSEIRTRFQVPWHEAAMDRALTPSVFEAGLLEKVARRLEIKAPRVLHPSEMQQLFRHVWRGSAPADLIERHAIRERLVPPPLPEGLELPDTSCAVRFAFSPAFPDTIENQRAARGIVEAIAATEPVVLLNNGFNADGLEEFDPGPMRNVWTIASVLTPSNNLAVQSAVIGRASAFIGAFGGLGCLAVQYGVRAVTVYSTTPAATPALLDCMRRTAETLHTTAIALHVRDLDALAHFGAFSIRPTSAFHGVE